MSKVLMDFIVAENMHLHPGYTLLKLRPHQRLSGSDTFSAGRAQLPDIKPGQFVQVAVPGAPHTYLRRPISVNNVEDGCLWLLVRRAGEGTEMLADIATGQCLNLLLPLGNGFTLPQNSNCKPLLVGGGVGIAPMLYLARRICELGIRPDILIGARSCGDLLLTDELAKYANLHISTDDGSCGEMGLVTVNSCLDNHWDHIYCCGPTPMMRAIAAYARKQGIPCDVSLENLMACGMGACLCCVEKTTKGNVCVCTDGPVFDINQLTWDD